MTGRSLFVITLGLCLRVTEYILEEGGYVMIFGNLFVPLYSLE